MRITERTPVLYLPESRRPRSPGIHVSGIIRELATELGLLQIEVAEELELVRFSDIRVIEDPIAILRINIGLAWEAHYIPMLPNVLDHPDEVKLDDVYMSPDGESVDVIITEFGRDIGLIIHEVKATYKSTKTVGNLDGAGSLMWMWQIKAYCKARRTRFARVHVLFMNGDYSWPMRPTLKCWDIEFSPEELDMNWQMLLQFMRDNVKEYQPNPLQLVEEHHVRP